MSYLGPATLVLRGTRVSGITAIHVRRTSGGLQDWNGTFRAGGAPSVDLLNAADSNSRLELPSGEAGEVLVQDLTDPARCVLRLLGSGPAPV
jgi:hypothetical protein